MKLHYRQSGGFAGLIRGCVLDTQKLSLSEAKTIEEIAKGCTHSPGLSEVGGGDLIRYELEISVGDQRPFQILADDATITAELVPLIEVLDRYSKPLPIS